MGEEADYDDLESPPSPSLWEWVTRNRPLLWGICLLSSFVSFVSCAVTVHPDLEVWSYIVTVGAALLAVAAFIMAVGVKPYT